MDTFKDKLASRIRCIDLSHLEPQGNEYIEGSDAIAQAAIDLFCEVLDGVDVESVFYKAHKAHARQFVGVGAGMPLSLEDLLIKELREAIKREVRGE